MRHGSARDFVASVSRDDRDLRDAAAFISYEHWVSYQTEKGLRIRGGRFLPACYHIDAADAASPVLSFLGSLDG
jgi:hypothetical protein